MKQTNFLENINKDVQYHLEGRYFLQRYAYHAFNYIDENKKPIKERVFSFIIFHGKKWDNSTHFNVCESELHTVYDVCSVHLNRIKAERAELVLNERKERKMYPKITTVKFENVTLTAVENLAYTNSSYSVCGYPLIGEKTVKLYANGKPYRYGEFKFEQNFEVTEDWILKQAGRLYVAKHNVCDLSETAYVSNTNIDKKEMKYVPYHFYIGYALKYKNNVYHIYDITYSFPNNDSYITGEREILFETDKKERLFIPQADLLNIEVVGELAGLHAFTALKNKLKYME